MAHLWVTSNAPDGNFFAFLEDVDRNGISHYVSDRGIRASQKGIHEQSPWTEMGIPLHRAFQEDYAPLPPGQPVSSPGTRIPHYLADNCRNIRPHTTINNQGVAWG
jgi:X-Pro dipeptidyl-peptidase C-terminal non-catalytic domain